ncbi:hypothetical protein F0562_010915 [Nyssa sinensis]|uniref:Uncharacterized protein n=1 Tax=Nyssa sinensis TaxID=561372 RepID=A0A5J5A3V5_9ASTE|nr:hypothetical protein F0562_010915 [Nyssa sinensis]
MVRTPCYDKNGMKKGAWSPEEDNKLKAYVERYGHWNWRQLPKFAGLSRCGKSCRLRWMNYLRPNVKRGNYSKEEEDIIIKLHDQLGNKWSAIAEKLPGRTDNEIKNHWHTQLKKHKNQNPETSEVKEQSDETSQSDGKLKELLIETFQREATQERELTLEGGVVEAQSQQTSESSQLSSESSCGLSSLNSDYSLFSGINWVADQDFITSSESFEEPIGNFWTEPFIADTSYHQNEFSSSLVDGGLISSYVLCHIDDAFDLFYQSMQELPQYR